MNSKSLKVNVVISIFLFYISVYGITSVYIQSMPIRAAKDVILLCLDIVGIVCIFKYKSHNHIIIFGIMFFFLLTSMVSLLSSFSDIVTYIYGIKVTLFPLMSLFLGCFLALKKYNPYCLINIIFFSLIICWVIQYNLGIDKLISMGYVFGVNVKLFIDGTPRYPSIALAPDDYAFLLAIIGLILESEMIRRGKKISSILIKILTFTFLYLSLIRSSILFWLVCQAFMYLRRIHISRGKIKYIYLSLIVASLILLPFLIGIFIIRNPIMFSSSSLFERFGHWFIHLPPLMSTQGIIGNGLGFVGAASRRTAQLGYLSTDYAVDNQYFTVYEQVGFIGLLLFLAILATTFIFIMRKKIDLDIYKNLALGLILGVLFSGLFTNVLELYPFNVFLYTYLGMILGANNQQNISIDSRIDRSDS